MIKNSLTLILLLLFFINTNLPAQKEDTIIHDNAKYDLLSFQFSNDVWTQFQVYKLDITIENGDTVKNKLSLDTFSIKRFDTSSTSSKYKFILSEKSMQKILFGKFDKPKWWHRDSLPELSFILNAESNDIEFVNCSENSDFIRKNFKYLATCLENSDDQSMIKYVEKWIEESDDCDFQKRLLFKDLGMLAGHLNYIVPKNESKVDYSVITQIDSTSTLDTHFTVSKSTDNNGNTQYHLSEDLERGESIRKKSMRLFYDSMKDIVPEDQRKNDAIRLDSIEEFDTTEILIDSTNIFLELRRNIDSYRLDADLKPVQSKYRYVIKKI